MIRSNAWLSILAIALVTLLCATCAPVDPPTSTGTPTAAFPTTPNVHAPTPAEDVPVRDRLKERIETAIDQIRERDLLTTNGFWTVFHGILGMGPTIKLRDPDSGQKVTAIDYICNGGDMRGLQFLPTRWGLDVSSGPPFVGQGHQDQFIAEMAQWGLPADKQFLVYGKEYTFMDFINHAKMRARVTDKQELSWAILVLGQYLGTDITWTNGEGEKLHFEDLVRYELDQPVETAACGGTHRLFGLTWVKQLHLKKGNSLAGVWEDVADKEAKYQKLAREYQNSDGSFSTNFFRGPGNAPDRQLRMNSSGHTLEWLALMLPDEELQSAWMQEAANAVALMFLEIQNQPMEGGTLYHAMHGLLIYYARVYDASKLGANRPFLPLAYESLPEKQ